MMRSPSGGMGEGFIEEMTHMQVACSLNNAGRRVHVDQKDTSMEACSIRENHYALEKVILGKMALIKHNNVCSNGFRPDFPPTQWKKVVPTSHDKAGVIFL